MKKLLVLLAALLLCTALFAVDNVGDYTLYDMGDCTAKDFLQYVADTGELYTYDTYGIFLTESGKWKIQLDDFDLQYGANVLIFDEEDDSVALFRWAHVDTSNCNLADVLYAVNEVNCMKRNWGTFVVDLDDADLGYELEMTLFDASVATIYQQMLNFEEVSEIGFDMIIDYLNSL